MNPTDKPMWPFGKDNPYCICGDFPNVNCPVHVTQTRHTDTPEEAKDDWLDTIIRKCQAETVRNYIITCKNDGMTVGEALLIPAWDERRKTAHDAIQTHLQEAIVAARLDELEKLRTQDRYTNRDSYAAVRIAALQKGTK